MKQPKTFPEEPLILSRRKVRGLALFSHRKRNALFCTAIASIGDVNRPMTAFDRQEAEIQSEPATAPPVLPILRFEEHLKDVTTHIWSDTGPSSSIEIDTGAPFLPMSQAA